MLTSLALAAAAVVLSGSVHDQSGGAVVGADILLSPSAGGAAVRAATDAAGSFRFHAIQPGSYDLRAGSAGFRPTLLKVRVGARGAAPLRIVLHLAELREQVTVDGGSGAVSTEAGENLDTVRMDRRALNELPILGNDIIGAATELLDSSSLGTAGASIVVDGMETSETGVTASAIQEVRINQNPYSAEYGKPGKGRIEVITRTGTTEFHGEFNTLFRDSLFDARNALASSRPAEQRRVFEGNLTGPVGRSRRNSFVLSGSREEDRLQSLIYAVTPSGTLRSNYPHPQMQNEWNLRVSRQMAPGHTVGFRYELEDESILGQGAGGFNLPETASDFANRAHHVYSSYRGSFGAHWVHEFSMRAGRHDGHTTSRLPATPSVVVGDFFTAGGAQADRRSTENHVQLTDTTLHTVGRHTIKFGLSLPDWSRRGWNDRTNRDGTFYFSSLTEYALGRPYAWSVQRGDGYLAFWQKQAALFVQEELKIRDNLTVAFGLRYDWQNYLADRDNLAPRLSVAWSPDRKRRTVIRAGAGIFYDQFGERAIRDVLMYNGARLLSLTLENPGYPMALPMGSDLAAQPQNLVRLAGNLRSPYLTQYSVGIERQWNKALAVTATYTGLVGAKLFRSFDANAPAAPAYLARPNTTLGTVREIQSAGRLVSHSLECGLRGSLTRYFKGTVQYTLGRAWNNTDGINALPADSRNLSGEWSHAPFDMRHRFLAMGALRRGAWLNVGLRVTATTGTPYTIITGKDGNHDGRATDRPLGVPRNSLRGPAAANLDLRWSRDFALTSGKEGPALGVTADAFNALNHTVYSSMVGNISSPLFGQAITARPARRMQFGLHIRF